MRSNPLRWLPIIALALLILAWLTLDLLPRFVGGLLGRGESNWGAWSGEGGNLPEITWDTTDPRLAVEKGPESEDPDPPDESASAETPAEEGLDGDELAETPPAGGGQSGSAGRLEESAAGGIPGEGPGTGRRRAATLLFNEWPSQELISGLERSGIIRFLVHVNTDGRVSRWELLESFDCGECLEEAERIVAGLRFRPALEGDRAVACQVPFEISFYASD